MFYYGGSSFCGVYIEGANTETTYPNGDTYCIPFTDLKIEIIEHSGPSRP